MKGGEQGARAWEGSVVPLCSTEGLRGARAPAKAVSGSPSGRTWCSAQEQRTLGTKSSETVHTRPQESLSGPQTRGPAPGTPRPPPPGPLARVLLPGPPPSPEKQEGGAVGRPVQAEWPPRPQAPPAAPAPRRRPGGRVASGYFQPLALTALGEKQARMAGFPNTRGLGGGDAGGGAPADAAGGRRGTPGPSRPLKCRSLAVHLPGTCSAALLAEETGPRHPKAGALPKLETRSSEGM